ncbi:MAG: EutN/CcmL family microcompartment protein [Lactobacillales bacterium]|jgi:ethanolamine utilization protein EutN|nr:EutN/CcmL family microcompartment protein [Lactobacillales bacterium]
MLYGKVTGSLWSTRKDEKLNGWKFMIVEIINATNTEKATSIIAADNAGAGVGDEVLITLGEAARLSAENSSLPVDAMIVGVVDSIEKEEMD